VKFTTGEVISAGVGKLCCEMSCVYKILNYLTGDHLFTHQLPRAFKVCEVWVREQQPWLNELQIEDCTTETWRQWLNDAIGKYGEVFELEPLPPGEWKSRDPIKEAVEMMGGDKSRVIGVVK